MKNKPGGSDHGSVLPSCTGPRGAPESDSQTVSTSSHLFAKFFEGFCILHEANEEQKKEKSSLFRRQGKKEGKKARRKRGLLGTLEELLSGGANILVLL